jgi:hypothetical protein
VESKLTCNVGNPASRVISTRPIEKEGGSDEIFKQVSAWLNECLHEQRRGRKTHANCPKPTDNYMPTRLIEISSDTDQCRLKLWASTGSVTEPYVALSYCWGGDQPFKLTQRWLDDWMVDIPWNELPQTTKDAVTVCQKLGIRFLWVDSICIMQDDANDKAVEISRMPHIYRNSTLTVAASRAAHVQAGFLGERTATDFPGAAFKLPFQWKPPVGLGSITLVKAAIHPEPLDLRAWAMQERLLSPRTVEFGTRQLRFICQNNPRGVTDGWRLKPEENEYRRDNLEDIAVLRADFDALQGTQPGIPIIDFEEGMDNWMRLVEVFTHRLLTIPADRILAISGIAERYGRVFGDQYCAGIWRSTFAKALFWRPADKLHPRPQTWQGPSWSWTSINGPVRFTLDDLTEEDEPPIVAIKIELAKPANPYGALLEGSGRLTLKARTVMAFLTFVEDKAFGPLVLAKGVMMKRNITTFVVQVSYDALDPTQEERDANNVALVELSSKCGDYDWSCRGLVVRYVTEDTHTRVGTFEYETDETNRRKDDESLEQWQQRVFRELSWFSGERTQVIDIV